MKRKKQRFLSSLPAQMKERVEFVNPKTMDEVIRKTQMCYQHSKVKRDAGRSWPQNKGRKGTSNFKGSRPSNYKNVAKNPKNRQYGKTQQKYKWPIEE